jgi:hypothetical protein
MRNWEASLYGDSAFEFADSRFKKDHPLYDHDMIIFLYDDLVEPIHPLNLFDLQTIPPLWELAVSKYALGDEYSVFVAMETTEKWRVTWQSRTRRILQRRTQQTRDIKTVSRPNDDN